MNETKNYVCPVCGKIIDNLNEFARHINYHSEEVKRKAEEEERQRKADQKKVDLDHLNKLRKVYEDASEAYIRAKEKYEDEYSEKYLGEINLNSIFDLFNRNTWGL